MCFSTQLASAFRGTLSGLVPTVVPQHSAAPLVAPLFPYCLALFWEILTFGFCFWFCSLLRFVCNASLVQARGCGFWVFGVLSTQCGSIPSITYILYHIAYAICHSMYSVVGATSVRSLQALTTARGLSTPTAHDSPGRRRASQYGVPRRLRHGTESPDACLLPCSTGVHNVVSSGAVVRESVRTTQSYLLFVRTMHPHVYVLY